MTLLRDALAKKQTKANGRVYSQEEIELVLAWGRREITTGDVIAVTKIKGGNVYHWIARGLAAFINSKENA